MFICVEDRTKVNAQHKFSVYNSVLTKLICVTPYTRYCSVRVKTYTVRTIKCEQLNRKVSEAPNIKNARFILKIF